MDAFFVWLISSIAACDAEIDAFGITQERLLEGLTESQKFRCNSLIQQNLHWRTALCVYLEFQESLAAKEVH